MTKDTAGTEIVVLAAGSGLFVGGAERPAGQRPYFALAAFPQVDERALLIHAWRRDDNAVERECD